jgi:hypothetical protein
MSLGDFDTSAVVYFKFTTFRPSTGAPFTLAGTPALSVYKDNSTTQTTTGVTLTADFDSVTGLNHVAIDTSDAFYSAGSFFDVVITTGTVDSVSAVGTVVGRFTLRKNSALKPTTAGRTLDVSSGGEAGIDFANIGSPTTTVNLSGTTIKAVTDRVSANTDQWNGVTVTGMPLPTSSYTAPPTAATIADAVWDEASGDHLAAGSTGAALNAAGSAGDPWTTTLPGAYTGSQAGKMLADILVDTGTTLQGELDGIQADTEDIQSRLPAALVGGRMDSSVGAMAANVLTASALASDAATEIAAAVRTNLAVELGRIDAEISSRMATFTLPTHFSSLDIAANGHVSADVKAVSHNAITASSIQGGSITAAKFAAGAIDANALATDAATEIATAVYTGQMTEAYRAAGVAPTLAQSLFELIAHMGDSAISGTTKTLRKIDGTTAKTFTLDSSTPTSITEAT